MSQNLQDFSNYVCTGEWRSCAVVEGGENYEVNDRGVVRHIVNREPLGYYINGYIQVCLGRKDGVINNYYVNRLVWRVFVDVELPDELDVDHRNRVRDDNRLCNLIPITKSNNNNNRDNYGVSAYKGLCFAKAVNKWKAQIRLNGNMKYIGYFLDEEEGARVFDYIRKVFQPDLIANYPIMLNGLDTTGIETHPKVVKFISKWGDLLD